MWANRILLLLCLGIGAAAQQQTVVVLATSLVKTPYDLTFSSTGHSYTSCSGDANAFGNFTTFSANCNTTSQPPRETVQTHHLYTYYTVLESESTAFLASCTRKWRWDKCPSFRPGDKFALSTTSKKFELISADGSKPIKLELVQAVAIRKDLLPPTPRPVSASKVAESISVLDISSAPDGAEVTLDGDFVGDTPITLKVSPGKHLLLVAKKGYDDWSRNLDVMSDHAKVSAELQQKRP